MRTNEAKGISDIVPPRRSGAGREQLGTGRLRRGGVASNWRHVGYVCLVILRIVLQTSVYSGFL